MKVRSSLVLDGAYRMLNANEEIDFNPYTGHLIGTMWIPILSLVLGYCEVRVGLWGAYNVN